MAIALKQVGEEILGADWTALHLDHQDNGPVTNAFDIGAHSHYG